MDEPLTRWFADADRRVLSFSGLCAVLFWGLSVFGGMTPVILKVPSIVLLAMIAFPVSRLLALALCIHSVGDGILAFNRNFLWAIPAFGLGHILYCRLFLTQKRSWDALPGHIQILCCVLPCVAMGVFLVLYPGLKGLCCINTHVLSQYLSVRQPHTIQASPSVQRH
jgi:uncharacterized membrane protein YhhN